MTVGLKFLLWLNEKFFNFKKSPFRYNGFSVSLDGFLWEYGQKVFVSQGWILSEFTLHTL